MAGGGFTFKLSGVKETLNNLQLLGVDVNKATARAVFATAQAIAHRADDLVPVDTGVLRSSQDVTRTKSFTQKDIRSVISYGGPSAPYAIVQHENLEYEHPKGGQAKFLEQPFLEETDNWPAPFITRLKLESKFLSGGSFPGVK